MGPNFQHLVGSIIVDSIGLHFAKAHFIRNLRIFVVQSGPTVSDPSHNMFEYSNQPHKLFHETDPVTQLESLRLGRIGYFIFHIHMWFCLWPDLHQPRMKKQAMGIRWSKNVFKSKLSYFGFTDIWLIFLLKFSFFFPKQPNIFISS